MSATGAETILIQVDIQANNTRLVELTKQLNENRDALKSLNDANKAGRISADELAQGQLRLKQTAADIAQETRILTKANQAQDTANKASAGSIEQLRAQLTKGTAAYNALSKAERDGSDAGQKLQASNKALSDELKRLEKAIGDTRRNVGNYEEAFNNATSGLDKFGSSAKALPGPLGAIGSGLVGTASGFVTATRAALAFLATPIGLVLGLVAAAVYAVKTAFEGSAEGQGKYAKLMAVVGTVLGNVKDVVIAVGEKVIGLFEHPQESLKAFGKLVQENLVNRFIGLFELLPKIGTAVVLLFQGKFAAASKVATDAVGKVVTGVNSITDAYDAAGNAINKSSAEVVKEAEQSLIVSQQRLQAGKLERQLITERAEVLDKVATLELQARQKEKFSAEQRRGFILEAGRLNDDLFAKEGKVAKLRQTAGALEATFAKQTKENLTEQAERTKDVIEANTRAVDARRSNQRLLNSLNGEIAADAAKRSKDASAAAKTAREDAVKAKQTEVEQLLLTVAKGSAAELVLLQRQIQLAADLTLAAGTQTAAQKRLILATAEGNIAQLQAEFNAKALENAKKYDAATVAEANREYAEAERHLEDHLNKMRALVDDAFAKGKIGENEHQKQLNAIDKAGNNAALVNAKDYGKDTGVIEKKTADIKIKENTRVKTEKAKIKDAETSIEQAAFGAASQLSDATIALFGQESAAGKAALVIKKTLALAEIAINLEKQLSANATTGKKIGDIAPPATLPLGAAYVIATDALSIAGALASATKIAGFKQGGYVSGPGTGTSDSIPARLSNGESVMNANSTAMFAPLLSHLNVLGGGVPFAYAAGGLAGQRSGTPVADGGLLARAAGNTLGIDYAALARAMARQPVQVDVRRITHEQSRVATPRSLSTLG